VFGPVFALVLLVASLAGGTARAQTPADDDIAKGIELYRQGQFDDAIDRLYAAVRQIAKDPAQQETLARAYLYVGAAYLGLGEETASRQAFVQAVRANPYVATDAEGFPGDVERFFRDVRRDTDLSSLPPRPTPTPIPITAAMILGRSSNADLERGAAQALAGESVDAATTLWPVVRGLDGNPEARVLRPRALLFLALAYARVGREEDARGMLREVLTVAPDLAPPPEQFPESFIALVDSVRQSLAPAP